MDPVNNPSHYTHGGIECIDAMDAAFGPEQMKIYCKISAFKYLWRAHIHKDGVNVNLKKAVWFIQRALVGDADA
jgi:TPR repeat protein